MTELLVIPKSLDHMGTLTDLDADASVIGERKFGSRLPGEFNRQQMTETVILAHRNDRKVYVTVDGLSHNYHLDAVEDYTNSLHEIRVDRIVFGDPAVVTYMKVQENPIPPHWSVGALVANHFRYNYWGKRGASRTILTRELNLDEIISVKENLSVEIEVQVQGMTCMFQSKCMLLGSYYTLRDRQMRIERHSDE